MFEIEQIRWFVKSTVERALLCCFSSLGHVMESVNVSCEAGTKSRLAKYYMKFLTSKASSKLLMPTTNFMYHQF
jgi:hypothetical protein